MNGETLMSDRLFTRWLYIMGLQESAHIVNPTIRMFASRHFRINSYIMDRSNMFIKYPFSIEDDPYKDGITHTVKIVKHS